MTVTEVSALAEPYPYRRYTTHGHLQANLVNHEDPSDSVELSLNF